jgi:hypothetical protein
MARRTRKLFQRERHQLEEPTLAQPIILAKLQRPDHRNSKKASLTHRTPIEDTTAQRRGQLRGFCRQAKSRVPGLARPALTALGLEVVDFVRQLGDTPDTPKREAAAL